MISYWERISGTPKFDLLQREIKFYRNYLLFELLNQNGKIVKNDFLVVVVVYIEFFEFVRN